MPQEYVEALRFALNHLYEPSLLRSSPLIQLLGLSGQSNPALALQQELIQTIEALKPGEDTPTHSRRWRAYEVLLFRYVQQWPQKDVAAQLGMSERQVRREQRAALEMLAHQLAQRNRANMPSATLPPQSELADEGPAVTVADELSWLRHARPEKAVQLMPVLESAMALSKALAAEHCVDVKLHVPRELPDLSVHPTALRQILLNLLGIAILRSDGGQVCVTARSIGWDVELAIQGRVTESVDAPMPPGLSVVDELVKASGGELRLTDHGQDLRAVLLLPAASQLPVLVVDDNEDTLRLYRRFAQGTRYRMITVADATTALTLAQKLAPQIIVLDIMMPDVDGLELLARFKQHPATHNLPLVVCTILPEEALVLSLGASAFLQKPFSRESLLHVLDALWASRGRGGR
ncbi:MAG: response regulator [Chloroflexi bacterium]|nr:response regulator [Chloroflexota bacterium]